MKSGTLRLALTAIGSAFIIVIASCAGQANTQINTVFVTVPPQTITSVGPVSTLTGTLTVPFTMTQTIQEAHTETTKFQTLAPETATVAGVPGIFVTTEFPTSIFTIPGPTINETIVKTHTVIEIQTRTMTATKTDTVTVTPNYTVQITHVEYNPYFPATLAFGQHVDISFTYSTNSPGGIFVWPEPYFQGYWPGNFEFSGSPLYPEGNGSGSTYFTLTLDDGVTKHVDMVKLVVKNADRSLVLAEIVVPADYTFVAIR